MKLRLFRGLLLVAGGLFLGIAQAAGLTPIEELGKSIFFDDSLSINQNQSCAACHGPEAGWTGPDSLLNAGGAIYEGSISGRFGNRKPPSSAYATSSPLFHYQQKNKHKEPLFVGGNFWDGRATGEKLGNPAADQAQGPFLNPLEQALPDAACIVYRVCESAAYPGEFAAVWGAETCSINWPADIEAVCATEGGTVALSVEDRERVDMAFGDIALSIAAYEASPESSAFTSKFDYSRRGMAKLTAEEQKGFALFMGKGKCVRCHSATPPAKNGALFTDFTYDNLGLPPNPENPFYDVDPAFVDGGLGAFLGYRPEYAGFAAANIGKHKVPTLRNVDLRPDPAFVKAYGHNGYFKSLKSIVHFYNTRDVKPSCPGDYTESQALADNCWPEPEVAENVNTEEVGDLKLTTAEEDAIVAFLKTLSDGYMP